MSYTGTTIRDAESDETDTRRNVARMMEAADGKGGEKLMATETTAPRTGTPGSNGSAPGSGSRTPHEIARVRVPTRSPRSELRAIKVVWKREMIRFSRDRLRILTSLMQPFLFLFVLGTGLSRLASAGTHGVNLRTFVYPGCAVHGGDVHRDVLRRVARVGPRVRIFERDDGGAREAQLAGAGQVPRWRHRGGLSGRDRALPGGSRRRSLQRNADPRGVCAADAAGFRNHRVRRDGRGADHADAVVHGADADGDHADVLPLRRAVPGLGSAAVA